MSGEPPSSIAHWAALWRLTPDGVPIRTRSGRLLPVRTGDGELAMLKVAAEPEEQAGAALMAWWDGQGAARVLEQEGNAILLERATGSGSLAEMARDGEDDEATRMLCRAVAALHVPRGAPPAGLVPLDRWFASLFPAAERHGGLLARCAAAARKLLDEPQDVVALHGDIHHGNVLDFGARGWLAIDPKGLIGERGFDYANLFCNPDHETALAPGRMRRRVEIVSEATGMEPRRLLSWILAWSALSAVWMVEDGEAPELDLAIAEFTAAELDA
ncbi:aminoglycoside phosphotransferase family protein [Methylopila sp. M107]|uniref:aminoglycoside phosphotransferase family protein n=1 Tax=Methylopila sp. M107 TaxID=1101190 RepID=UPI00036D0044|nr:aminoglycoside phosphotransferase family protein [Methylopila sp. M107]